MEPNLENQISPIASNRKQQIILSIILVIVLLGLVGGYIYIGMNKARLDGQDTSDVAEETSGYSDAERQAILDALSQPSPDNMTDEERATVMDALSQPSPDNMTDEERVAIINNLNSNR